MHGSGVDGEATLSVIDSQLVLSVMVPSYAASFAPTSEHTSSGLAFTYRRTDLANEDASATIAVSYSTDLVQWTPAVDGENGISIVETDDFYAPSPGGIDRVVVHLPSALQADNKLFARLGVTGLPSTLFKTDFESNDGGFTVLTSGGTAWQYGAVSSLSAGGGAVIGGNSGTRGWGTNLTGAYAPATETKLRSPVIDLTGIPSATLSFAEAIDIAPGHTLVVNVIDETTDAVLQSAIHTSTPDPDINSAPWTAVTAATSIIGDRKIRIEWHFTGNGDNSYLGAYIDDVVLMMP